MEIVDTAEQRRVAARDPLDHDPAELRRRRIAAGLAQADVAERAGTSAGHLSELERGTRNPSPALLARLAGVLGCEIADLLARVP